MIELGFARSGSRAYLAVGGGFQAEPVFNSVSTVPREGLGGLHADGSALKSGDLLPCKPIENTSLWQLPEKLRADYRQNSALLRVVLGYQQENFSETQKQLFFNSSYSVTKYSDRMGYRLEGSRNYSLHRGHSLRGHLPRRYSIPRLMGSQSFLLNDRQTMGGYPKIGSVLSVDIGKLAQLSAGGTVRFEAISMRSGTVLIGRE